MKHIHVVNEVIEKYAAYTRPLHMAFVDYEKAFGSVHTAAVLKLLKHQGIEETYIRLLDEVFSGRITLRKQSDKFPIRKRVRQGDAISPKQFTACLEGVFRTFDWENTRLWISEEYLSHLKFSDDIVVLSKTAKRLQKCLRIYDQKARSWV